MTRRLREFVPITKGEVLMYVCGPTVYNYIHVGNARSTVAFDTIRRYFEYRGYEVAYISNFTDVDDKIINRAKEEGITPQEVADKYIAAFRKDVTALGVKRATYHPRVVEFMADIIRFVEDLIEKGYAYESQGDVYFRVEDTMPWYKSLKLNLQTQNSAKSCLIQVTALLLKHHRMTEFGVLALVKMMMTSTKATGRDKIFLVRH